MIRLFHLTTCPDAALFREQDMPWFLYVIYALGALFGIAVLGWIAYTSSKRIAKAKEFMVNNALAFPELENRRVKELCGQALDVDLLLYFRVVQRVWS